MAGLSWLCDTCSNCCIQLATVEFKPYIKVKFTVVGVPVALMKAAGFISFSCRRCDL